MDKIDSAYKVLSISHQCKLLGISRSQYYYEPSSEQDEKDFNLLMQIKEVQGLQISQEVSVSSEKQGNQISESGMVNGYHLHKAADRECLPDGNNRLVLKKGLELARIQHDGHAAVRKPAPGNNRRIRLSCNLQHRSGKPVYIYLKRYETMKDLKAGINAYFNFYNTARFHQSLDFNVPDKMYKCFQYNKLEMKQAA